jgi:hypothetical protein
MPLIPQQDIVTIVHPGGTPQQLGAAIQQALASYPPCRIVTISTHTALAVIVATVVVETV